MRIATNGWLYEEGDSPGRVTYVRSVRTCALVVPQPLGLVWHATGTVGGPGFAERLARRIQTYRAGVDRPASFHAVVGRDGTVVQCISMAVGSWHVGRPGEIGGRHFDNVNRATIGIELENAGVLNEIGGHLYAWPFYRNPHAPERERRANPKCRVNRSRGVLFSDGRIYDGFTHKQIDSARELVAACKARFALNRRTAAYAHADFAAPARTDPGPLWMRGYLPRILDDVFGDGASPARPAEVEEVS
jgi:hypothetical protein